MKAEELIKLNELRNNLDGKELSFIELDNFMIKHGYYTVIDDGIIDNIKQDENVIYTSKQTNESEIQIFFNIIYNNGKDESEESFIIKIIEVGQF